jgi:hypothetical protein
MITGKFVWHTRNIGASLMAYGCLVLGNWLVYLTCYCSLIPPSPSLVTFSICDIFIKRNCFRGLDLLFELFNCLFVFR